MNPGLIYLLGRLLGQWACRLLFGLRTVGAGNVPASGGAILASNHQSYLDPVMVGCRLKRPCWFAARRSLFSFRPFGWLISRLGAFPIERGRVDARALRRAEEVLRSGGLLVIFPEGTRSADGRLGRVEPGVAALAARAGVPVVPAFVHGAWRAWPRSRRLPRPRRVAVFYGPPLFPPEAGHGRDGVRDFAAGIRTALELLRRQAYESMPLDGRSAPEARGESGIRGPDPCGPPARAAVGDEAPPETISGRNGPEPGRAAGGGANSHGPS